MKKKDKKVKDTGAERNIDMTDHMHRIKALGLSERAVKKLVRIIILLIPVLLIVFWLIKTAK